MTETPIDEPLVGVAVRKPMFATISAAPGTYKGRLLPIIIGAALFMTTLDATIIANALPSMARSFHESPLTLNVAITVYLLSSAVFLPLSGWAADRFGARSVFSAAIVVFTIGSVLCGLSQNLWQIVGSRAVQGVAGAMMMPVGRLVLLKTVAKSDLVRAMSYLTMPAMLGPVLGPLIGGTIVTYASWRWIFFINVPVGLLAITLVSTFVPNIREDVRPRLDVRGFLLTGFGLAGLIFGFENVGKNVMPAWAVASLLIGGAALMAAYVWHEKRSAHPMVNLKMFAIQTFRTSVGGGLFLRMMIGATPFLLAMLLQVGFGMSAIQAGSLTFTSAAGALLMKTTAQPIIRRFGFRPILVANALITTATFMCYALFTKATPQALMIFVLLTGGFFRSLQFTALNAMAYADVPQDKMSSATTLSSMSQPLAQSLGIGVAALLIRVMMQINHDGEAIRAASVTPVFLIMGLISLIAVAWYLRLPKDAGEEVSGFRTRVTVTAAEET